MNDLDEQARLTVRVPVDLRQRAKIAAVKRDESLQQLVIRAIVTELEVLEDEAKKAAAVAS
jgi:predicted HicB family RNase H-like nuclease